MFLSKIDFALRKIARRIGFENQYIKDARGQSSGIWLLWDSNNWDISILKESNQFVHLQIGKDNTRHWFVTIVYGSPHFSPR